MVPMFESWRQHPPRDPPCNSYFFILNELLASSQFLISAIFRDFFRGNFFPFPGIVGGDKKWSSPPRPSASFFIFSFFRWHSPALVLNLLPGLRPQPVGLSSEMFDLVAPPFQLLLHFPENLFPGPLAGFFVGDHPDDADRLPLDTRGDGVAHRNHLP